MPTERELRPLNLELRNEVTRQLDIEGVQLRQYANPGITVVQYPTGEENIAAIWFNDPTEKGLFSIEALEQYERLLDELARDDSISGLLFTDNLPEEGKVSFYGIDVQQVFGPIFERVSRGDRKGMEDLLRIGQRISERIYTFPKPVVGGMRRLAVGGGFEFMIPAHYIVQGPRVAYSLPECQLDVPAFVKQRYGHDLDLGNPNYTSGSVLFPGWIGNVLLYNKLVSSGMPAEQATGIVDDFTFNGTTLDANKARELGVANVTVDSDSKIIDAAVKLIGTSFTRRPNNLLRLPSQRSTNPAAYDTPGKVAGAVLLYYHGSEPEPYNVVGERAVQLMIDAMHHGLAVEGPLPYPEYARIFNNS